MSLQPWALGLGPKGVLLATAISGPILLFVLSEPSNLVLTSHVLLIAAAAVYLAFAFFRDHSKLGLTFVQALLAVILVVLAEITSQNSFVVAGLIGHAIWDAFHLRRSQHYAPYWYAGACIYVDLAAAGYLVAAEIL
jgi:hypothetical protein